MVSNFDYAVALAVAILVGYFGFNYFQGEPEAPALGGGVAGQSFSGDRDIVAKMESSNKNVVVFYGSQTGTAEDCASKLAKDLAVRFGLRTMIADLENYDFDNLGEFPEKSMAFFCMASYGEGEPTDNAVDFWTEITGDSFDQDLRSLRYCVFGLGNSTYEQFNQVGRELDATLAKHGAQRVAPYGEGDDGNDTMEDDFVAWKEQVFNVLKSQGLDEKEYEYQPTLEVETATSESESELFLGEANKNILAGKFRAPFHHSNPLLAPVKSTRELFKGGQRSCIQVDFDIAGTGLRYTTGDHLAFWAQNSNAEVDRFLKAVGLAAKRSDPISLKALDPTAKIPFPVPTTYDTIVRYWLEINGAVSRQVLGNMAGFAPTPEIKARILSLSKDKALFHEQVTKVGYNIAGLMLHLSNGAAWDVPFTFFVENLPSLQVRYYSISSSSAENKDLISITAVVERETRGSIELRGVATNYIHNLLHPGDKAYNLAGPRGLLEADGVQKVPVHVRRSNFKLPSKATVPIIMVGPGTGVAPFRAFVRERAAKEGDVGKALLFFGSRTSTEDALYAEEWPDFTSTATRGASEGPFDKTNFLEVINAFSREGPNKVYVQHRMAEHSALINKLLEQGAHFYVCGDASNMARSVHTALVNILVKERGVSEGDAEEVIKKMKNRNLYQEDIW